MTYDQFAVFSRVHLKPFDWSTDGCSGPKFTQHVYKDLFDKPCRLHDFGYRNYGRGLHLGRNETTRAWIDLRFKQEMDRRCNHFTGWQSGVGVACRAAAHLIYDFERKTGEPARGQGILWLNRKATTVCGRRESLHPTSVRRSMDAAQDAPRLPHNVKRRKHHPHAPSSHHPPLSRRVQTAIGVALAAGAVAVNPRLSAARRSPRSA
jgi:hypothetical protein